jgi:hypothetical protein
MPYSHEVLVVSEPSMMGDVGIEDERTISRIENAQFDQNSSAMMRGGIPSMDSMMSNNHPLPNGMIMPSVMNGSCKSFAFYNICHN